MAARPTMKEQYACGSCNASYTRADHLIRHVRSHTRQRPFVCTICAKSFGRQDLLKRHMNCHNLKPGTEAVAPMIDGLGHIQASHRVHHACRACAEKKLKCADEKPCKRCREKNLICETESPARPPMPLTPPLQTAEAQDDPNGLPFDLDMARQQQTHQPDEPENTAIPIAQPSQDLSATLSEPLLLGFLGDSLNFTSSNEYDQFHSETNTNDMDFSFLNDFSLPDVPAILAFSPNSEATSQQSTLAIGAEAYRGMSSLSTWNPRRGHGHIQEQQGLILSQNARPLAPHLHLSETRTLPKKDLPPCLRDHILLMVLRTASRPVTNRIVTSFPTVDVLRDLIYYSLQHLQERQVLNFIHASSFNLTQQRPELLGSLIAYACVTSPSQSVRSFGYALQDSVRMAINELVQDDHSALRDLDVAQAFYIQLYLGYWSGSNRIIEVSESNSMLGATMLRRGERLRADHYGATETFLNLSNTSLEETWMRWVEHESAKRLVYFAMTLDFHVAAARNVNGLFHLDEMNAPLPSSAELWAATSASDWRELLEREIVLKTRQSPALSGVLLYPSVLADKGLLTDIKAAASIYLAGYWGLIGEYWRMNTLVSNTRTTNDFVLNARHTQLTSILDFFKTEVTDRHDTGPEGRVLHELVSLHLHVPFNDIAQYCGKGTEEDARASATFVQRWHETSEARTAVWHAGQVIRTCRMLPAGDLTDIYIVALYHAGLVLWTWGLLCRVQTLASLPGSHRVVLDEEETSETMKFIKTGRNRPYLTDREGNVVPLEDVAMIPVLVNDIISANWDLESMPSTTAQLFHFMHEISKLSSQKFGSN